MRGITALIFLVSMALLPVGALAGAQVHDLDRSIHNDGRDRVAMTQSQKDVAKTRD